MMVFEDPSRRRWRWMSLFGLLSVAACAAIALAILQNFFTMPPLPALTTDQPVGTVTLTPTEPEDPPAVTPQPAHGPRFPILRRKGDFLRSAFLVQSDPRGVRELADAGTRLDVIMPDFFAFDTADGSIRSTIDPGVADALKATGAAIFPRVSNTDPAGNWKADEVSTLLRRPAARTAWIDHLVEALRACGAAGVNVDIESLNPDDGQVFTNFVDELAGALHRHRLFLTVDVPMYEDPYDYEALGKLADAVVLMAYDQAYETSAPGPVAGQEWFEEGINDYLARVPAERLIIGMGAYGYDWKLGSKAPAESLSFAQALARASLRGATVKTDERWINSTYRYADDQGDQHVVFFLDAVSIWNEYRAARAASGGSGLAGFALWRLGFEEPGVWSLLLDPDGATFDPSTLTSVEPRSDVVTTGTGEFYRVRQTPVEGDRWVTVRDGLIEFASYDRLPKGFEVTRTGARAGKKIALTFDDGPDEKWTPALLDVLKSQHVPATFFLVGDQVDHFPQIVRREADEGHTLGNHTFLHPNIQHVSDGRLRMELNLTERSIESASGRQTVLFRPPFDTDSSPTTESQLRPLGFVAAAGYLSVGADVESGDYRTPGVNTIVTSVLDGVRRPGPHIVCMHDAGGDRSQTVEAVRTLIPLLRSEGFEFVGVQELAGLPLAQANPPVPTGEWTAVAGAGVASWLRTIGWGVLSGVFFVSTVVSIARIVGLGAIVLRSWKRATHAPSTRPPPPVTVLIPAYNEAKVIAATIAAVLASDHPDVRVLVVDDGSTDGTADVVREAASRDARVTLLVKANAGKSEALNVGFARATTDVVVTIDADTIVMPGTVRALAEPFLDPRVDAVCGNVQVGNVKSLMTSLQDVEYVTSQNYDRRAFESLNCISVVPGATGGWRRSTVLAAGGYSSDTLTEDADLTLTILRRGGRIVYAPEARSITEAPETVRALFRQRFRWSFGTLQSLVKHRGALGRGTLGCIALPNMLIFQVLFPTLAPLGDAALIWSLFRGDWTALAVGYTLFLAMDLVGSLIAFHLDRRAIHGVWAVVVQRFCYRQFMYVVTLAALLAAVRGRRHGWNKLERSASVSSGAEVFAFEARPARRRSLRPQPALVPADDARD